MRVVLTHTKRRIYLNINQERVPLFSIFLILCMVEDTSLIFTFVSHEDTIMSIIYKKVRPLMKEYIDVLSKDLLLKLSPMRGIHHHKELISRASLPNKTQYHIGLKEYEELRKTHPRTLALFEIMREDL